MPRHDAQIRKIYADEPNSWVSKQKVLYPGCENRQFRHRPLATLVWSCCLGSSKLELPLPSSFFFLAKGVVTLAIRHDSSTVIRGHEPSSCLCWVLMFVVTRRSDCNSFFFVHFLLHLMMIFPNSLVRVLHRRVYLQCRRHVLSQHFRLRPGPFRDFFSVFPQHE